MSQVKPRTFLANARREVAARVRELRTSRKLTQSALANELGLSQSRLSEIERGDGSFSAEQFLLVLRLFNVPVSEFVDQAVAPTQDLQNALARLGATHLHETTSVVPSEQLDELVHVVREALVDGSPRFVTALAPVLFGHARTLNLRHLQSELARLGYERRLPWLAENILEAVRLLQEKIAVSPRRFREHLPKRLVLQTSSLQLFLNYFDARFDALSSQPPDIIDSTIRTPKTVEHVIRNGSEISRRWGVVTTLTPDAFVEPLKVFVVEN